MAGAVLGIIFNLLHPRSSAATESVRAELELVRDSDIWTLDHIGIGIAVVLGTFGLVAIALSMFGGEGELWARAAALSAIGGGTLLSAAVAIDGIALREFTETWSASPDAPGMLQAAQALLDVDIAVLTAAIGSHFGVTALIFGAAILATRAYSQNLGYASLVAGVLGFITALILAAKGADNFALNVLFPIASLLDTVVLAILGWQLWQRNESTARATTGAAVTPPAT